MLLSKVPHQFALLCLTIIVSRINYVSAAWSTPELLAATTPDVTLEALSGRFGIGMNEEITAPFTMVIINYNGPGTPYVWRYNVGTRENLQLAFVRSDDEQTWLVNVQNRQDYERDEQQLYDIELSVADDPEVSATKRVRLIVAVLNIFDNVPSISMDGQCVVDELQANVEAKCKFTVYHADGTRNNPFQMSVAGRGFGEERKFGFSAPFNEQTYSRDYTLMVLEELRFEERAMYNFMTVVHDVVKHSSQIVTMVQVIDVPSMPPQWTKPFSTARFLEKQAQSFKVAAVDGDTELNKAIWYELGFYENQDYSQHISIDTISGDIAVEPINRDALNQEIFPFYIIAYKSYDRSWAIEGDAVLVVDDVNDNAPVIASAPMRLQFLEATYLTLPIDELMIDDIDLGVHATYVVSLEGMVDGALVPIDYAKPFVVIPNNGYKQSFFTITVADAALLDYENVPWQEFKLTVVATENQNSAHVGRFEYTIELLNWNDELPIFAQSIYVIRFLETIGKDELLGNFTATDRDIGDRVIHSIIGQSDLRITKDGYIWTTVDNSFDYERQPVVYVQLRAMDTMQINGRNELHTAYAQLQINLIDVNDKSPELRMPRNSPNMDENKEAPYRVTIEGIVAIDPDTSAEVHFTIDWEQTYATKAGQEAEKRLYQDCFLIETDTTDRNRVIGYVVVNPSFPYQIDYEEYEVIYLHITATDLAQKVNDPSTDAFLTIRINDLNDNAPLFILDTLETIRSVIEEASEGTLVGTIFARDIDGPQFNRITYTMIPTDATPAGLINIDPINGELRVAKDAKVACDVPVIFDLTYDVTLSDGDLTTSDRLSIYVHDINNRQPTFGQFERTISRYENITTGELLYAIVASDVDRDDPNNAIQYAIDYTTFADLSMYIQINTETGVLKAMLQGDTIFDRDEGYKVFEFQVIISDNYRGNGRVNQASTVLKLILLDVNDNAPKLPSITLFRPIVSENALQNALLGTIVAIDIDDENTPNAKVGYRIVHPIVALQDNQQPPPDASQLFQIDGSSGALRLATDANGFYGQWSVEIEAFDHGHLYDSEIQLSSSQKYTITVEPYNFHAPVMVSPSLGQTLLYRLSFYDQQLSRPLTLIDGSMFPMLKASDADGGIYGEVSFEIASFQSASNDAGIFNVLQLDSKSAHLYLQRPAEAKLYHLNVRAIDGGGRASEWSTNLTLVFVDMSGEPVFDVADWQTDFTENAEGLAETRTIPMALDPKNIGIEDPSMLAQIYYFIDPAFRPEDARLFKLDSSTRELRLAQQLDREAVDSHTIRVVATNRQTYPPNPQPSAFLLITVSVNDVNDNPPRFEYASYGSGITTTDLIGKTLLTLKATDPDLDDVITYTIKSESYSASDSSLAEIIQNNPLQLNPETGELHLNFAVSNEMKGHIEFVVQAFDLVYHEDETLVKIFIIADTNRIAFQFLNTKQEVDNKRERAGELFSQYYAFDCYIDDVTKAEVQGVAQEQITTVRTHFIKNNEAIETAEIFSLSNNILLITGLRLALLEEGLNLQNVLEPPAGLSNAASNETMKILLIAVSVLSCVVLSALIAFFTIRERSIARELKALSTTVYEPEEIASKQVRPPNTNVFADESIGRQLRESKATEAAAFGGGGDDRPSLVFDNLSLISGGSESDFVGIEDDPTFIPRGNATGTNAVVINGFNANNSNI